MDDLVNRATCRMPNRVENPAWCTIPNISLGDDRDKLVYNGCVTVLIIALSWLSCRKSTIQSLRRLIGRSLVFLIFFYNNDVVIRKREFDFNKSNSNIVIIINLWIIYQSLFTDINWYIINWYIHYHHIITISLLPALGIKERWKKIYSSCVCCILKCIIC